MDIQATSAMTVLHAPRSEILRNAIVYHWEALGKPNHCTIAINQKDLGLMHEILKDFQADYPFYIPIVGGAFLPGYSDSIALDIYYLGSIEHSRYLKSQQFVRSLESYVS